MPDQVDTPARDEEGASGAGGSRYLKYGELLGKIVAGLVALIVVLIAVSLMVQALDTVDDEADDRPADAGSQPTATAALSPGQVLYIQTVVAVQEEATASARVHAQETVAARPTRTPRPTSTPVPPPYKLALISASCTQRADIGFNECEGFVRNISGVSLENVTVVIEWVDESGVPQAADQALIDYNPVLPDQQSPWSVIGTYNPSLRRFRVVFKELLGGTILTRDDRQQ